MKIAFPIGSTALLLLLLALAAHFKGAALLFDALSGVLLESHSLEEASKHLSSETYTRFQRASSLWFTARNIFLGLGLLLGLYWFSERRRTRYLTLISAAKPSDQPYRRDRRRRR